MHRYSTVRLFMCGCNKKSEHIFNLLCTFKSIYTSIYISVCISVSCSNTLSSACVYLLWKRAIVKAKERTNIFGKVCVSRPPTITEHFKPNYPNKILNETLPVRWSGVQRRRDRSVRLASPDTSCLNE